MISQARADAILKELGYTSPTPLTDFQRKEGLAATGKLDEATSQRLELRLKEHRDKWPWYVWAGVIVGGSLIAWGTWKLLKFYSAPTLPALPPQRSQTPLKRRIALPPPPTPMPSVEESPETFEEPPDTLAPVAMRMTERYVRPEPFKSQLDPTIVAEEVAPPPPSLPLPPITPRPRRATVMEMIAIENQAQKAAFNQWASEAGVGRDQIDRFNEIASQTSEENVIPAFMKEQPPTEVGRFRELVSEERKAILRKRFGR